MFYILLQLLLLVKISFQTTIVTPVFGQVDPRFQEDDIIDCYLSSRTPSGGLYGCLLLCHLTPDCRLFCLEGNTCHLYKAYVAWHWQGIQSDPVPDKRCFSNWGNTRDAAAYATISGSAGHRTPELAAIGYMCYNDQYTFGGYTPPNLPWWVADLGAVRKVTSVRLLTRLKETSAAPFFEKIKIRVGNNNPGNGDFSGNALLAFYRGPAAFGEILTFTPPVGLPMDGSVVSLKRLDTIYMVLPDVQILVL